MPRVELEADTIEELVDMIRRWVAGYPQASDGARDRELPPEPLDAVLRRIKSPASQQFLREVAARTLVGGVLVIDDELRARCGLPPGSKLVGVLGVANRTMRLRANRELVIWDPATGGYRMTADDARVVVDSLGPPVTEPSSAASAATSES